MKLLKALLIAAAGNGFIASAVVHVEAVLGIEPPFGELAWVLHVGVFIVFLPAAFQARAFNLAPNEFWEAALGGCRVWMRVLVRVLFFYALANFAVIMYLEWGNWSQLDEVSAWRAFSGHWMLFYALSFAMLYSARRLGHPVPRADEPIVPQ